MHNRKIEKLLNPFTLFVLFVGFATAIGMQCVPSSSVALSTSSSLVGRSRAGNGTTFVIPQLKWMFDCGALVDGGGLRQPRTIFLTHTHSDHVFTLTQFTHSRDQPQQGPPLQIYLPQRALPLVQNYLEAFNRMITMDLENDSESDGDGRNIQETEPNNINNATTKKNKSPPYELIGMAPGQEFSLRHGGKDFLIRVIECVHRVDCLGYSIFERQQMLKNEYRGLPAKEICQLKKQGMEITTSLLQPFLCYLGDTTAQVFDKHQEILKEHSIIVVECSFLDETSQDSAVRHKHMHWFDLKPIVDAHPHILFVLTHLSLRYSSMFVRDFLKQSKNVHPMLIEREIHEEWTARQHQGQQQEQSPPGCNCFVCKSPEGL